MLKSLEVKKLFKQKRLIGRFVAILIFYIVAVAISYSFFSLSKVFVTKAEKTSSFSVTKLNVPTPDPYAPVNILLLGYGGPGHDGPYLTDTMIVAHIDPKTKKATLVSIPRDIWIPLPVASDKVELLKINAAYGVGVDDTNYPSKDPKYTGATGGGEMAKYAINYVTGLNINYFVSLDFAGFLKGIDYLGGVDVKVPTTFDDAYYPIEGKEKDNCGLSDEEILALSQKYTGFDLEKQFTCRYELLHFDKGVTHMDGTTALKFVRSRHSETSGGDFARSERQFALLTAVKTKLLSIGLVTKLIPLINTFSASVRTDFDISMIPQITSIFGDPSAYKISLVSINDQNVLKQGVGPQNQYILEPKEDPSSWQSVKDYINSEIERSI